MENILENLVNHIGKNMAQIKVVDEDYGQLEMIDDPNRETYTLTYPAVLIDAAETNWSNVLGLSQSGTCTVRVRLIIDCYDDTHYRSGTVEKIKERDAIRKQLHLLLQGHRTDEGGALMRTASRFYTYNHGIKVYESTYTVAVTEYITKDEKKVEQPIQIQIKPILKR